jgi:hypothetical protein
MRRAYLQARRAGYSTRESLSVAVLVARLSLRDPPTDVWGTRIEGRREIVGERPGVSLRRPTAPSDAGSPPRSYGT